MESRISKFVEELECQVLLNDEQALLFVGKGSGISLAAGNNCRCNGNNCRCHSGIDNCMCNGGNNCKCNSGADNCDCTTDEKPKPVIPDINTNPSIFVCK